MLRCHQEYPGLPVLGGEGIRLLVKAHDPGLAAQRAAWRSAGGRARATPEGNPVELLDVQDVRKGLAAVIGSTWELQNTAERSRALCQLYLGALRTFELGEFTERVAALEQVQKERANDKTERANRATF